MKSVKNVILAVLSISVALALAGCAAQNSNSVVNTPVSGSFKPGFGGGRTVCAPNYVEAMRFTNKASIWWPQPAGTFTRGSINNITGIDFTQTPAVFEVLGGAHLGTPWCTPLPGTPQFPLTKGEEYQFLIYFTHTAPPKDTAISFNVQWQP